MGVVSKEMRSGKNQYKDLVEMIFSKSESRHMGVHGFSYTFTGSLRS